MHDAGTETLPIQALPRKLGQRLERYRLSRNLRQEDVAAARRGWFSRASLLRAEVRLWGRQIGAVVWDEAREIGVFEYEPSFLASGIEVAPLTLPLRPGVFDFPALSRDTFKGLPGLLADSLPDKFGNLLIERWLAEQGPRRYWPGILSPASSARA